MTALLAVGIAAAIVTLGIYLGHALRRKRRWIYSSSSTVPLAGTISSPGRNGGHGSWPARLARIRTSRSTTSFRWPAQPAPALPSRTVLAMQRMGDEIEDLQLGDQLWRRSDREYLEQQLAQSRRRAQMSDPQTAIGGLRRKDVEYWEERLAREDG
jgi:hypothetical protein